MTFVKKYSLAVFVIICIGVAILLIANNKPASSEKQPDEDSIEMAIDSEIDSFALDTWGRNNSWKQEKRRLFVYLYLQ